MINVLRGRITVQTFRDHEDATGYPDIKTGTLEELRPWFEAENAKGMGIFYAVNSMVPGKRGRDYVQSVEAYYVDVDGIPDQYAKDMKSEEMLMSAAPPTVIVYTKNGVQALWDVMGAPIDAEHYKRVEMGLITAFNADRNAKDIARVLRMPGTMHVKQPLSPYLCTVMYQDDDMVYNVDDITSTYPPPPEHHVTHPSGVSHPPGDESEWAELLAEYSAWHGNPGYRHDSLLIAAGNAVRCEVNENQAFHDLLPIVMAWRGENRLAITEVENAVSFAYRQGVPYSRRALQNRLK